MNRNDANSPSRLSDHDPAIAYFATAVADLSVVVEADPADVDVGGTMTFTATVANAGPDDAEFPGIGFAADAELPDLAIDAPDGVTCDAPTVGGGTTTVACTTDVLADGGSIVLLVTATAPAAAAGETVTLTAAASSQTPDLVPGNDSASAAVAVAATADLQMQIEGPEQIPRGDSGFYNVWLDNAGPASASSMVVDLIVRLRPGLVTMTTDETFWTCELLPSTVYHTRCTANEVLPAGEDIGFGIGVETAGRLVPPRFTVSARVQSANDDPMPANNRDEVQVSLTRP